MSVYTKKGDKGMTSMYDASNAQMQRVSKSSLRVWAIGSVDEINSYIGVCLTVCEDAKIRKDLERVQRDLFIIGSTLAGGKVAFPISKVKFLEREIDEMESELPVLKNFILPGGVPLAAYLHFARAMTRRAERRVVVYNKAEIIKPTVLQYINRLSDYLFVLARFVNRQSGISDTAWRAGSR